VGKGVLGKVQGVGGIVSALGGSVGAAGKLVVEHIAAQVESR
jgi:hypothetical protein